MTSLQSLLNEEHLQSSTRGQNVISLGTFLVQQGDRKASIDIAVQLCSQLNELLGRSKKDQRFPTMVISKMWSSFHILRFSPKVQAQWEAYQTALHTPTSLQVEGKLLLQLLLDRILKRLVAAGVSEGSTAVVPDHEVAPEHHVKLTLREQNAVRYMAGYVLRKLKKKYKERSKRLEIQRKRQFFLSVLSVMESRDQDDATSSCRSTCDWVEMIDREGLCHVNDDTYLLVEAIEVETRHYLQPDGVQQVAGQAVQQQILSSILDNSAILSRWDILASPIPPRYKDYSLELLKEIASLWITVRCFSFTKILNDKTSQDRFKKHGTRKTLQLKN